MLVFTRHWQSDREGTFEMHDRRAVSRVRVMGGDTSTVGHVGVHMLGELADRIGLTSALSNAVVPAGERAPVHDRGRLLVQAAVTLASGGVCVADVAVCRNQPELFGEVASDTTFWRTFNQVDAATLDRLRAARATARAAVWQHRGTADADEVIIDVDATLIEIHSENKQCATPHYKRGFGFHPMLAFTSDGQALAGILRPGNAAANSGVDQLAVVDLALAQLPPRSDGLARRVLVRADTAGDVAVFIDGLVERHVEFSIGARVAHYLTEAIRAVPDDDWQTAINTDGKPRNGAQIAVLDTSSERWPIGTRAIVRREHPHPGAQLRLWDHAGWRHQVVVTNSPGEAHMLELRHRQHAEMENHIRNLKASGAERLPFTRFRANQAWFETVLAAADLLRFAQMLVLDGDLARAEPKTLRYRLLHAPGRLVHTARRTILRINDTWPWARGLLGAYQRSASSPDPMPAPIVSAHELDALRNENRTAPPPRDSAESRPSPTPPPSNHSNTRHRPRSNDAKPPRDFS
jgi:hypothetical protein